MKETHKKFAVITVDTNDGDYITNIIEITEEQAMMLTRVANAIKKFLPYNETISGIGFKHAHNFPIDESIRPDLGEKSALEYYVKDKKIITATDFLDFIEFLPYCEYGSHSVIEIKILVVIGEIKLL